VNNFLVGIDEAGRGTWAGPLVAAAVALTDADSVPGLNDSKLLSPKRRDGLFGMTQTGAISIGIGWVGPSYIDKFGLTMATALAMKVAVDQLDCKFNLAVIDGNIDYLSGRKYRCEIKADQKYPAVSAASIIAKVARDRYMSAIAKKYPQYGFEKHFGYGTATHISALKMYGVTPLHRLSYKPVKAIHVDKTRQTGRTGSSELVDQKIL